MNAVEQYDLLLVDQLREAAVPILGKFFLSISGRGYSTSYDYIAGVHTDILIDAYYRRWDIITNYLTDELDPANIGRVLTYLIYAQSSIGFSLVRQFIVKTDQYQRIRILRATIQSGNEEQFKYLVSTIENFQRLVRNYNQVLNDYTPIGHLYFQVYNLEVQRLDYRPYYNFLYDAYAGANQNIINYFRDLGLVFSNEVEESNLSLSQGRYLNLSNPISFYNIISQIDIDPEIGFESLVSIGVDAAQLMIERFPNLLKLNILNVAQGNIDLLNFLLQKVMNIEGFQQTLVELLESEEVEYLEPITTEIVRSYLKKA